MNILIFSQIKLKERKLLVYATPFVGRTLHFKAVFDASRHPFNGNEVCAVSHARWSFDKVFSFPLFSISLTLKNMLPF